MGLDKDIIVDEKEGPSQAQATGTTVEISGIKSVRFLDKMLETIRRVLVERLLPYFVDKERTWNPCLKAARSNSTSTWISVQG